MSDTQATTSHVPNNSDDSAEATKSQPMPMDTSEDGCQEVSYAPKISPPITLLQEICSRNGLTPEYQLLSTEGSVHEPTFKIAVTVADIFVTASGQSKKKARHAAAKEAIMKLRLRPGLNLDGINFDSMASIEEPSAKSVYSIAQEETNPVGKLQEICMKMKVNPPDYDTCNEEGLAHERVFILCCAISRLNLKTFGRGRSKKQAKRQAAENMLDLLEQSEIYDKTANSKGVKNEMSSLNLDSDDNSHFVRARGQITETVSMLDCSVSDLKRDVEMIDANNVDEDYFYNEFQENVDRLGYCRFEYLSDTHCLVHVLDQKDNIVITGTGFGTTNVSAMKECVKNAYRIMMVMLEPTTGTGGLRLCHLPGVERMEAQVGT